MRRCPSLRRLILAGAAALTVGTQIPTGSALDLSGYAGMEARGFPSSPADARQDSADFSLLAQPELHYRSADRRQGFDFVPFMRYSSGDAQRSHVDLRELAWFRSSDEWAVRAGVRKVFWGVTESQHLVDIINQTDLVENSDGEEKLGQPMLDLTLVKGWGSFDLFVLTGFRERTFPGRSGRLRTLPRVDTDQAQFESGDKRRHVDVALRWTRSIGDWDAGLAHFSGTGREPRLLPGVDGRGQPLLIPFYEQIEQDSLDLQTTQGQWLLKLEAIQRRSRVEKFFAATAGFEYTLVGLFGTAADLGLIAEYLYDERGSNATTPFQDDIFTGLRLALNDVASSEVLFGVVADRRSGALFLNLEASRRVGQRWKLSAEARAFSGTPAADPLFSLRRDDYVSLELLRYF